MIIEASGRMVKHRKKKVEEKKKMTKWNIILPLVLGAGGTGIAFGLNYFISGPPPLTQCIQGDELAFDQEAFLYVTLDGAPMDIPDDIGRSEDCIKPVHVHENDIIEEDGIIWTRIHSSYVKPTRFTLNDVVNLWGLDLDQYEKTVYAKQRNEDSFSQVDDIRTLVLTDDIWIKMELLRK